MSKPLTTQKLIKKLQIVFNAYIRKRDEGKPCISCLQVRPLQAGHFFSVHGWSGLRFDEDNVHGECAKCNCFDEHHLRYYEKNLKIRIGEQGFKELEEKAQHYKQHGVKWSKIELQEKISYYTGLVGQQS